METRKLQEVGGGSFTVTIPKEWARSHGFNVGMELQLYTHRDGSFLVRSSDADVACLDDATIDIDRGGAEAAQRAIRTAHAVGFNAITLRRTGAFSDAERKAVRSTVRDLIGTNILSETDAEITIKHLLDTTSVPICQSIVQLRYVVVSLLRDAVETLVDAADTRTRVHDRAEEARRSVGMITRHFSRSLISHVSHAELDALDVSRPELFTYYAIARRLEAVTDQAVLIARAGERLAERPPDGAAADVCSVADDVACAVDNAVTAALNGDTTKARDARGQCDDAVEAIETLERRLYDGAVSASIPAVVALSTTLSHLRRTADCGRHMSDTAARAAICAENIGSD
ncbi:MAG: AbrB/MazE/SpoVT family DNA-binding domain-containing protein [Natronomonas sp.]|uniref:AbrB/MazE/SpoVT family DNA-binding domain-containing protein n=1 Tax=Natronomonas sp. TaxID=2184060 RepID=UPI00286FD625|nr:AbrB/MazE/SpoVT family DNA-binding domain-containing protein [Natronomonas sp.]MDR9429248.1 AbrB/MazE/SpoVT family DNA-binding domain-containing protein [Natronomonas sp.]